MKSRMTGVALLPSIMDYARNRELRVLSLSTLGPSLVDVFLEITGRQVGVVHHETGEGEPRRRGQRRQ